MIVYNLILNHPENGKRVALSGLVAPDLAATVLMVAALNSVTCEVLHTCQGQAFVLKRQSAVMIRLRPSLMLYFDASVKWLTPLF
jgi:hypothetical protein